MASPDDDAPPIRWRIRVKFRQVRFRQWVEAKTDVIAYPVNNDNSNDSEDHYSKAMDEFMEAHFREIDNEIQRQLDEEIQDSIQKQLDEYLNAGRKMLYTEYQEEMDHQLL